MGGIIGWIVFGAIAGALGKLIMPGKDPGGFIVTTLLGIAGSVGANYLGNMLGIATEGGIIRELLFAIVGVLILLGIYRLVAGKASS